MYIVNCILYTMKKPILTSQRILDFLTKNELVRPKALIEHLRLTPAAVFRQLATLSERSLIRKQGKPPRVFYSLVRSSPIRKTYALPKTIEQLITERFLKVGPDGTLLEGIAAFIPWCLARGLDPVRAATDYASVIHKVDVHKKDGLINATRKLTRAFPQAYLDALYYLDFYSVERFGKTRLGELILYAKQSQDADLIRTVVADVRPRLLQAIKRLKIDAIGFIPPTVRRTVQFMKELEKQLKLGLPTLTITKIKTPIIVPQKTLSKLEERIENARQSIVVEETRAYRNILLIDDAVGSGATIHEIARQIRQRKLCKGRLIGLGLAGSFNGFEVINEV